MGGGGGGVRQQASAGTHTSPTPKRPSGLTCMHMHNRAHPFSTMKKPPADHTAQVFRLRRGSGLRWQLTPSPPPPGKHGTAWHSPSHTTRTWDGCQSTQGERTAPAARPPTAPRGPPWCTCGRGRAWTSSPRQTVGRVQPAPLITACLQEGPQMQGEAGDWVEYLAGKYVGFFSPHCIHYKSITPFQRNSCRSLR